MRRNLLFLFCGILVLVLSCDASAGLRAWYEFEGNYNNSVGGPAGTPVNDVTIVYDAVRDSNVLSLDGAGDYLDCGNDSIEGIDVAITFSAWIKTSSFSTSDSAVSRCYGWRLRGNGGVPRFSTTVLTNSDLDGTINVADNSWHHVACVYDGAKKYIYIDGQLNNFVSCTGLLNTGSTYIFTVGAMQKKYDSVTFYEGFPKDYYEGLVDDVRVYDDALSRNEIWLLVNTGTDTLEAEDATLNGVEAYADAGASGGYRVRYFDAQGDYILYDTVPDGNWLEITYSLGSVSSKQCSVYVDGVDVNTATFVPTGGWGNYETTALEVDVTGSVKLQLDSDDQTANGGESCASQDKITVLEEEPVLPMGPNHPFLIVHEANYPALQARASQWPWNDMKDDAISDAGSSVYNPGESDYGQKCYRVRDISSSNALAYILDPNNRTTYKNKIRDQLNTGLDDLTATRDPSEGWGANTPLGGALFNAMLAMDIIYNDLTPAERVTLEAKIENLANLEKLPCNQFIFSCFPLSFEDADGSGFGEEWKKYKELIK